MNAYALDHTATLRGRGGGGGERERERVREILLILLIERPMRCLSAGKEEK